MKSMKETLRLAVPLAVAQLATFVMGMVDTACVGRVSPDALGAVAIGNAIHFGLTAIGMGVAFGLDPLVSQAVGAGDAGRAWRWWRLGRVAAAVTGVPLAAAAILLGSNLAWFGVDPQLHEVTADYVLCRSPGAIFFLVYLAGRGYLQCHQDTRPIIMAAVVANLINLVLDLLLVFGDNTLIAMGLPAVGLPPLGAIGAGLTTTLSSLTLAVVVIRAAAKHRPSRDEQDKGEPVRLRTLLHLGIPMGLQTAAEVWLFALTGVLAGRFGAVVVGGHQIALTLAAFAFMFALGVSSATSVLVGQAIGAGEARGVRRAAASGALIGMLGMGVAAILFVTVPRLLARLLTDQEEVLDVAVDLLGIAALFALFDGLQAVIGGALRGLGDARVPFVLTAGCYWLLGFPAAYWMAFHAGLGLHGLWYGLTGSLVAVSIVLTLRFKVITGRDMRPIE